MYWKKDQNYGAIRMVIFTIKSLGRYKSTNARAEDREDCFQIIDNNEANNSNTNTSSANNNIIDNNDKDDLYTDILFFFSYIFFSFQ